MDAINDFFVQIGSSLGVGGVMIVAGAILVIASRRQTPENGRVMKWIGIPMMGCGGCLVVIPVIIILAVLGLGAMIFSGEISH